MSVSTMVCPRCAPELGGTSQIGGMLKKISGALLDFVRPQFQNGLGAYGCNSVRSKLSD